MDIYVSSYYYLCLKLLLFMSQVITPQVEWKPEDQAKVKFLRFVHESESMLLGHF